MKKLFPLVLIPLLFSCSHEKSIHALIDEAVQRQDTSVLIPPGLYTLQQTIQLDGVSDLHIRAGSRPDPGVTLSSSLRIPDDGIRCVDLANRIWEIRLPELTDSRMSDVFRGYAGWPELFIDGVPLQLARYPDDGYLKADSILEPGSQPRMGDSTQVRPVFVSHELTRLLAGHHDSSTAIYLNGYWKYKWYDETLRVDSLDPDRGVIRLAAPHYYGLGEPAGALFYAVNHPAFLNQEGEYYFDTREGLIRFILPDTIPDPGQTDIRVALHSFPLIRLVNCRNITLEGLDLNWHAGTAIELIDCESVSIRNFRINGLSETAVRIEGGRNCGVSGSALDWLGADGILLSGGKKETLEAAGHFVTQCTITRFSRHQKTYAPAVRLLGVGQVVSHNTISQAPHNAVLFAGNDHLIAHNVIRAVCLNTADAGAIYCGRDWTMGGTVIRENTISDLGEASHHHNWAVYLDDLASGITVEGNVIEDCPSGILVGGGRYNQIVGNRIINCNRASIMYDARGLGWYQPYLNDPEHTLWTLLEEVPADQAPWKDRFPWLMDLRDDNPALPRGVTINQNVILESAPPEIHPTVKQYGSVQSFQ